MKTIAIITLLALLLAMIATAGGYTDQEKTAVQEGVRLSFQVGQAYDKATLRGDVSSFNALVDQWNAWVIRNFGQDTTMLMQKMTGPMNLQAPYILANNTTTQKGIVHDIDGMNKATGADYKTNDVNLLPDSAIKSYQNSEAGRLTGDGYLGGV
jgi:hypothetical protein